MFLALHQPDNTNYTPPALGAADAARIQEVLGRFGLELNSPHDQVMAVLQKFVGARTVHVGTAGAAVQRRAYERLFLSEGRAF